MNKRTQRSLVSGLLAALLGCVPSGATVTPDVVGLEVAVDEVTATATATATVMVMATVMAPSPTAAPAAPQETATATATAPPGFSPEDEFADTAEACSALVPLLVEREDLREPILDWCLERVFRSSRNGKARSRLDGSWIHDRDRPAAKAFYRQGLRAGYLDPDSCEHHVVDKTLKRDRRAREFPSRWPYGVHCDRAQGDCRPSNPGHMLASVADAWHENEPDYERFGTRGPIDISLWVASKYLGGCFSPEALDRHDVAAAVTIERSEDLCLRLERRVGTRAKRAAARARGLPTSCRSLHDLRAIWHPKFWYSKLREALR